MSRFCSQVWGRTTTQLHEWELEEMDEETGAHWDSLLAPRGSSQPPSPSSAAGSSRTSYLQDRKALESWEEHAATGGGQNDAVNSALPSDIAPFNEERPRRCDSAVKSEPVTDVACRDGCRAYPTPFLSLFTRFLPWRRLSSSQAASPPPPPPRPDVDVEKARVTAYGGKRSPFFGPEKIVLDPRIRALHNAVMRDLVCFFVVVTLVSIRVFRRSRGWVLIGSVLSCRHSLLLYCLFLMGGIEGEPSVGPVHIVA